MFPIFFRFLLIVYSHVQFFFFTRQYVFRLETRTYVLEIIIKNMNRKYLLGTSDEEGRERKKERKKEGKLE